MEAGMCIEIICGDDTLYSIQDAIDRFGAAGVFLDVSYGAKAIPAECCLCPVDLEKTASANGYRIVEHGGDQFEVHFASVA